MTSPALQPVLFLLVIVIIVVIVDDIPHPRHSPRYHDVHHGTKKKGYNEKTNGSDSNFHSRFETYMTKHLFFSTLYPFLNIKFMVAFNISVPREKKANIPELLLLQISMTFFFLVFLCFLWP